MDEEEEEEEEGLVCCYKCHKCHKKWNDKNEHHSNRIVDFSVSHVVSSVADADGGDDDHRPVERAVLIQMSEAHPSRVVQEQGHEESNHQSD